MSEKAEAPDTYKAVLNINFHSRKGIKAMLAEIEKRRMLFEPEKTEKDMQNEEVQTMLLDFIRRVSADGGNKTPEEVKILPEMVRLYINGN